MTTVRFLVSGRVQGVFFRAHTRKAANRLSLTGHAINLTDGRVEVLAQGSAADVDAMESWLWQGSPLSRVTAVNRESVEDPIQRTDFQTG